MGNKSLSQLVEPSPELAAVIGGGAKARTAVTTAVWDYIKQHQLQDAKDRRMINADDKLKVVFGGKEQVSMFEMTALVSKQLTAVAAAKSA